MFQKWWLESNWRSTRTQMKQSIVCVNSPWSQTGTRESSFWYRQTIHHRSCKAIKTLYMYINTNKTNNKNLYQNHFSSWFSSQIMKTQTCTLKHWSFRFIFCLPNFISENSTHKTAFVLKNSKFCLHMNACEWMYHSILHHRCNNY